jgi:hypothetical protein
MRINPKQINQLRRRGADCTVDELGDIIEIWTPQEIKAYVYNVGSGYGSLNNDIQTSASKVNPQTLHSWNLAYDNLIKFVVDYDESGWFNKHGMGPVRAAERFQDILEGFRQKAESEGVIISMKKMQKKPSEEPGIFASTTDLIKTLIIGGAVIGGIYWVTKKYK